MQPHSRRFPADGRFGTKPRALTSDCLSRFVRKCITCCVLALTAGAGRVEARNGAVQTARRVSLQRRIAGLLSGPSSAHWGISVVALNGRPIYSLNDSQAFNPASNVKLFTTAAAFALLPGNLTFTTSAFAQGPISPGGKLQGDLVLLGAGDATISGRTIPYDGRTERPNPPLAALEKMADEIAGRGIRSISGDIVGDDTWFPYEPYPTGWGWDDLQWGYGAPISALTVNDNVVYLNATPAQRAGETANAAWLPATSYYTLENSLTTVAGAGRKSGIDREPGSLSVRLFGEISIGSEGVHAALSIEDPAEYAARSLREMLIARGIQVGGRARARHRFSSDTADFLEEQQEPIQLHPVSLASVAPPLPPSVQPAAVLASHISYPLSDDLVITNKVSQNLHAEILLRTLGKLEGADGSLSEGSRVIRQFLLQAGVAPGDFVLYDGSGLSQKDLATPRAFTTVLLYAARQSWGGAYRASLPVGGEDGTLFDRFKSPLLSGKIFAKTGTVSETAALSGYLTATSGQTLVFSILCNDHLSNEGARQTLDKIVTAIAESN